MKLVHRCPLFQTHIHLWDRTVDHSQVFFRNQTLCTTISGNPVPVLTITAQPKSYSRDSIEEFRKSKSQKSSIKVLQS